MRNDEIDPHAILHALGLERVTAVVPVHGGSDTTIWRVEYEGKTSALRLFRPGEADACMRERIIMAAAREHGIPVPRIEATGTWRDRPALLLSWCSGRPLGHELRARPWRAWPLGIQFGRMQARIHAVSAPPVPARRASSWITWQDAASEPLRITLQRRARDTGCLLHLDYHVLNVLTDGARVTGVLDWSNAQAGDPRADLARTVAILRLDSAALGLPPWLGRTTLWFFEQGLRYGYRRIAEVQRDLAPFYAWAGAVMERDLAPKRSAAELAPVRAWTKRWTTRAFGVKQHIASPL